MDAILHKAGGIHFDFLNTVVVVVENVPAFSYSPPQTFYPLPAGSPQVPQSAESLLRPGQAQSVLGNGYEVEQLVTEYVNFYNFERISLKNGLTPIEDRCKAA